MEEWGPTLPPFQPSIPAPSLYYQFVSVNAMHTQNEPNQQQPALNGATILAIISVVFAAVWIAFAYYKGNTADSSRVMLLNPVVPILLIVLLTRVYRWIDIRSIVILEIVMISVWLFMRLLGVLMPFILGFGFAYFFRFIWRALPLKKQYQRGIATVAILLVCGGVLFYTGRQVSRQASQMGVGLLKFYYERLLPYAVGEVFTAVTISVNPSTVEDEVPDQNAEKNPPTETFYLSTNNGIYEMRRNPEGEPSRISITNGAILGKRVQALAASGNVIYAGTQSGLYRYYSVPPAGDTETFGQGVSPTQIWHKVTGTPFDTRSIETINVLQWDDTQIYVGTQNGLYISNDAGETWQPVDPTIYSDRSIISIISTTNTDGSRAVYVASTRQPETGTPLAQEDRTTTADETDVETASEQVEQIGQETTNAETASEQTNVSSTTTTVHRYLEGTTSGWQELRPPIGQVVYALTALTVGNGTVKDVDGTLKVSNIGLYAGTADGLYELYEWGDPDGWRKTQGTPTDAEMPALRLLTSASSGLYVGNNTTIWHRATLTAKWQPFTTYKEGISHTYRDQPIVEQVKSYLTERIPTIAQAGGEAVKEGLQFAGSIAFGFGGFVATVALALIVFVYANQSFDNYFRSFLTLVPDLHRETAKAYMREIDNNLQEFLKGLVTVIAIVSIISAVAYSIIGVPFALVIGLLAGICNAIPTFGPFIGGGFAYIAMLMGLAAGDFGLTDFFVRCAFVLGTILGIQAIDNSLISPQIMSDAVDVDPLLIMFAVMVGAAVLGFWGVLLAIPIIVVIKSVIAVTNSRTKL